MDQNKTGSGLVRELRRIVVITIAAVIMAMNFNSFVSTGGLFPGGAAGITFLIQRLSLKFWHITIPYAPIYLLMNSIPVFIGFKFIGKKFTLYSCLMIVEVSILTDILPSYVVTYDTLLIAIFGGLINGAAVALCIIMGATSGGLDFISIYMAQKRGADSWNFVLGLNAIILLGAGFFFGWDKALYSIIFQFTSIQVLHLLDRSYQQETLLVVTDKGQEVCNTIYEITHHGATLMKGEGAHAHKQWDVVYSVVASSQSRKVVKAIKDLDPEAFVNTIETEKISGRFYQEPKE